MNKPYILKECDIKRVLKTPNSRFYFVGNLKKIQPELKHFINDNFEIGFSHYKNFTIETPHYHTFNHEYNYILSGEIKIYLFNENLEIELKKGDFFVIKPDMPYICKVKENTEILFAKYPGGNDKVVFKPEKEMNNWIKSFESQI